MNFNQFCKQFIIDRNEGHPLDCYKYPISFIAELYEKYKEGIDIKRYITR